MDHNKKTVSGLIKEAVRRINNGVSRTLTARRVDETPPQDSRHLTDTRTRVSTLLEYALSYELNHILMEKGEGYWVSNVLWNVFPDLLIRDPDKKNVMGLEVKALHTAAEEKSANLHIPLPIIRKGKDFIVILLWGWMRSESQLIYPHIHYHAVFDAWLIAKIRDVTWLMNDNDRIKGIDISTPVISTRTNEFKAEEGNMGKLMRIHMHEEIPQSMPYYSEMLEEGRRYQEFKAKALILSVRETISDIVFALGTNPRFICTIDQDARYPDSPEPVATADVGNKTVSFVAGHKKKGVSWSHIISHIIGGVGERNQVIVYLGPKLEWKIWKIVSGGFKLVKKGSKPETELPEIIKAISG